jgi:putative holliday junction resolvase
MALDVGTKTIGVAVSDPLGMLAHPVVTLSRKGVRQDTVKIAELVTAREVGRVVVGLPLELDGTEERSARLARQIGVAVRASTGLPVGYLDERYSSVDAERQLIEADVSRERRKAIIDQQAAVLILQSFLDAGESALLEEEA